jgi:uroporphyrinogen-III synthase
MRLLVTRPEPDASALAQELRGLGHEPVLQPLLEFRSEDFDANALKTAEALIFTSGNALRALQEKLKLEDIAHVPLFCAGEKTARRASEAGFSCLAATARTAEELAAKIVNRCHKGTRLVHVTGKHQAFDLAGALAREGGSLFTLSVYDMVPRAAFEASLVDAFKSGRIGGVILMSPRTAEIFAGLCAVHGLIENVKGLCYFCLAKTVAKKLEPLDPAYLHIAEIPSRTALLALIAALPPGGHDHMNKMSNKNS